MINTLGIVGSFSLLIKIGIHIFIKLKVDKKFYVGASGKFLNPVLFFPITDDVTGYLNQVKKAANAIYYLAIALILIFVIGTNLH